MSTLTILSEIFKERRRQHEKWGQQDCPSLAPRVYGSSRFVLPADVCTHYGVLPTTVYKKIVDEEERNGEKNWTSILLEELTEAIEEAAKPNNNSKLRQELIQVAAVTVAWLEHLDRQSSASSAASQQERLPS